MGWFKPTPMTLVRGEPVHQMVARALLNDAIRLHGDILRQAEFHFVGPHGYVQRGVKDMWKGDATDDRAVAQLCEEVQADFNEYSAAIAKAREFAAEHLSVEPVFKSLVRL